MCNNPNCNCKGKCKICQCQKPTGKFQAKNCFTVHVDNTHNPASLHYEQMKQMTWCSDHENTPGMQLLVKTRSLRKLKTALASIAGDYLHIVVNHWNTRGKCDMFNAAFVRTQLSDYIQALYDNCALHLTENPARS